MSLEYHVLLFAAARTAAGSDNLPLSLPPDSTVADLRGALYEAVPALKPLASSLLIAVNEVYASDTDTLPPSATIACFPPVSGG